MPPSNGGAQRGKFVGALPLVASGLEAGDSPDVHMHHPFPGIRFRQDVAYSGPNVHVGAVPGDCTDDVTLTQRCVPRGPIMMLSPRHKRTSRGCAPSQRERTYPSKSDVGCHPQTEERSGGSLWVLPLVTPRLEAGDSPDGHMHHPFPGIRFRQDVAYSGPNVHVGAVPGTAPTSTCTIHFQASDFAKTSLTRARMSTSVPCPKLVVTFPMRYGRGWRDDGVATETSGLV